MNRRTVSMSVCACAALGAASSALGAFDTLYGCEYPGFHDLSTLDQSTGALNNIGPTGRDGLGDMTSDTRDGSFRMWAVQMASKELVQLDPATGAETGAVTMNCPDQITSIAFDVVSGKMYGNSSVGYGAPFEALYEIDPSNGNCTFVGRIVFDNVYALAFDQAGTLYGVADATSDLISISLTSGNGTFIADVASPFVFDLASRPSDGVMFAAVSGSFYDVPSGSYAGGLHTINLGTGALTAVGGQYVAGEDHNVVGLAFGPVPTPGAASALAFAAFGAFGRRSRR